MVKKICILCLKPVKKFNFWKDETTRKCHRKCWLEFRCFEYRHYDLLFSKDRGLNKAYFISPTNTLLDKS